MSQKTLKLPSRSTTALGALAAVTVLLLVSPSARASAPIPSGHPGYWAQTICSEGDEIAPTDGFSEFSLGGFPIQSGDVDTCLALGGGLTLHDYAEFDATAGSGPAWVYQAPAISTIAGGFLKLTMKSPGGEAYIATPNDENNIPNVVANCDSRCTSTTSTTANIDHYGGWQIFAVTRCVPPLGEATCTKAPDAEMLITSGVILLRNESKPAASGIAGTLLSNPASGTASLTFNASDENGPGVYRAVVQIDGAVVWQQTPNLNNGECVARGTYEESLQFRSRTPCPQKTAVDAEIPTAGLSNGTHQLTVNLEDAAGNSATVYSAAITIANHLTASTPPVTTTSTPPATAPSAPPATAPARGAANGTPASEQATLTAEWASAKAKHTPSAHLATTYGHGQKVAGKLTNPAGAPIADAAIEVTATAAQPGASPRTLAIADTAANGTFTATLPATLTSGSVTFAYRSHLGDPLPAATSDLTVSMPAKVTLSVSSPVTSVGKTIEFSGRIAGPIPPGGKQVVMEAREHGGEWVQFHTPTANASGMFHSQHRFRFAGPALYEFRAVCKHEADFPFSEGKSRIVSVWER